MKSIVQTITLVVFICSSCSAFASSCDVEKALPTGQKQIASGTATADYDGETVAKGDQRVYLKITNKNLLGVSYTITIAQDTTPANVICTYSAILLPQTSVIFSGSLFAEPPIGWKATVSVGSESDAGVLTYVMYSAAPKSASPQKDHNSLTAGENR